VSLPLGIVAVGLLLAWAGIVGLVWLVTRRRSSQPASAAADAPWLRALLDELGHAVIIVGLHGRPTAWNQAAVRVWGAVDDTLALPLALTGLVRRVLDTRMTETIEIAAPDNPEHRLRVTASWLGDDAGVIVQLHDSSAALRSAEAYRRLISAVAHELRTPLTGILGHADILGSCRPDKDEALWRRSRDFIAREARRLARLVEDLLTLSRLDLAPLQRRPVNLRAVAEEAISALFQSAETRGVRLSLHSPSNLPRVLGDRDRLEQVFVNLLDNAVKYSPSGSEAGVHLTPSDGFVEVEIKDIGVGIAPQDLPHIFDPLYRGERGRDAPGVGLGLTIVRTILEQHGVTINVQSAPHQGTTFHFSLPFAQSNPASAINLPEIHPL
jgi:signal transduction histidine kinase